MPCSLGDRVYNDAQFVRFDNFVPLSWPEKSHA